MCIGCYEEYGHPTPTEEDRKLGEWMYSQNFNGFGNLHIVLSDWNIEDEYLDWCLNLPNLLPNEKMCLERLKQIPLSNRAAAMFVAYEETEGQMLRY